MKRKTLKNEVSIFATKSDVKQIVDDAFDSFARIMKRCFDDVYLRMDGMVEKHDFELFKKTTDQSLYELKMDTSELKDRTGHVENRLGAVETKLDSVVSMYQGHNTRITRLEKSVRV